MRTLLLHVGMAASLVGACQSPCAPGDDPTLVIGQGERAYEPLDASEPRLEIIHGTQGGYHVALALEATHLAASDLLASSLSGYVDDVLLGHTRPWVEMRCNPDTSTLQSWNNRLIWDATPEQLAGRTARIEVELTDLHGTSVSATTEALLWDPSLE